MSLCRSITVSPFAPAAHWPTFVLHRASVQSVCQLAVAIQHQISMSLVQPRAFSRKLLLRSLVGRETRSNTTRLWVSITSTTEHLQYVLFYMPLVTPQSVIFHFVQLWLLQETLLNLVYQTIGSTSHILSHTALISVYVAAGLKVMLWHVVFFHCLW